MFSKAWNRAVTAIPAAAIAASGLTFAPQAAVAQTSAPTIGQCVAPAVLSEQLKGEDQKIIYNVTKNGVLKNNQNKEYSFKLAVNATSTPDGKSGYLVQQCNNEFGQATGQLKADLKVSNVRLYSDNVKSPLTEMKIDSSGDAALKACASSQRATCDHHNKIVDSIYAKGGYIAYQATSTSSGNLITIYSRAEKTGGIIITDVSTGASTFQADISNADYSAFALNIGKKIPVNTSIAAISPTILGATPR